MIFFVLDDVGYGQLGASAARSRRPTSTASPHNGLRYANMHTTALCSPTRSCILTGRNHHSNGVAASWRSPPAIPATTAACRLRTACCPRCCASRATTRSASVSGTWRRRRRTRRRALPPLAARARLRALLRLSGRRNQPVVPDLTSDNHAIEQPKHARGGLSPQRGPGRPGDQLRSSTRTSTRLTSRSSCTTPPAPRTRRTMCRRSGRIATRANSTPVGTPIARRSSRARRRSGCSPATRAAAARPRRARVGLAPRRPAAAVCALHGGVRRVPVRTPTTTSGASSTRWSRSASSTTR